MTPGDDGTTTIDDPSASPDAELDRDRSPGPLRQVLDWSAVILGAVVIALVVRSFLFQPFWIPSASMEGTLREQDRVMVNKLSYRLGDIGRGDVIVFERPDVGSADHDKLIKRVIGLGGDVVEGRSGAVLVNGVPIDEPYLDPADVIGDFGPITVPDGELFMMGDNRDDSYDSRFFGTVPEGDVVGRAFVLFWPLDRLGTL